MNSFYITVSSEIDVLALKISIKHVSLKIPEIFVRCLDFTGMEKRTKYLPNSTCVSNRLLIQREGFTTEL